jgi:hypothetical protein
VSVDWSPNFGACATQAYLLTGQLENPFVPTDEQKTQAIFAGNAVLKAWQAFGINLFRQERSTISVPAMTAQIEIVPRVMGIEQVSWVVQGGSNPYHRPMDEFSWVDYFNLPNPNSNNTSGPSVYMFNRQNNASYVYIWPLSTLGGSMIATVARTVDDVNDWNDAVDFPDEWTEAYVYNLADRLMDYQGVAQSDPETAQRITQHAAALLQRVMDFDRPTSIWMRPWNKVGQGYGRRR